MSRLEQVDPEIAKAIHDRDGAAVAKPRADRLRELRLRGGARGGRLGDDEQVRRGVPGPALLRRLRDRGHRPRSSPSARAKELFGAEHVNVQPHSGSQANMAVYFTLLKPGDTVLAPNLAHGGHLTAGSPINFSGTLYQIVPYGVRARTRSASISTRCGISRSEHRPEARDRGRLGVSRGPSTSSPFARSPTRWAPRSWPTSRIRPGSSPRVFIPSPLPYADFVTTTTHKTLRGPRGGMVMCRAALREGPRPDRAARHTGRPADARHRGQGGGLPRGADAGVARRTSGRSWPTRERARGRACSRAGYRLVSGGTDTHLMLVDLTATGHHRQGRPGGARPRVDHRQQERYSRSTPRARWSPAAIRIGTPAVTTRGMKEPEMVAIAAFIDRVLTELGNDRRWKPRCAAEVAGAHGALPALPGAPRREVPLLRPHRGSRGRLARRPRRGVHPAPAGVPQVQPALHDLRVHRGRAAARGQARWPARALRPAEAPRAPSSRRARSARSASRRSTTSWPTSRPSCTSGRRRRSRSLELGELVMEHLQKLDQVAYVRFASVYRQFKDIDAVHGRGEGADQGRRQVEGWQARSEARRQEVAPPLTPRGTR